MESLLLLSALMMEAEWWGLTWVAGVIAAIIGTNGGS